MITSSKGRFLFTCLKSSRNCWFWVSCLSFCSLYGKGTGKGLVVISSITGSLPGRLVNSPLMESSIVGSSFLPSSSRPLSILTSSWSCFVRSSTSSPSSTSRGIRGGSSFPIVHPLLRTEIALACFCCGPPEVDPRCWPHGLRSS